MKPAWHTHRISELCEVTSSKRTYAKDHVTEGVPFYRSKEIIEKYNGQQHLTTELFITEEWYSTIKNKFGVPAVGDVLITSRGSLGVPYVVKNTTPFYFADGNLTWFRKLCGLESMFLYYWFLSPDGKAELKKCTIGSSQQAYTIVLLKDMEICLPTHEAQRKIAGVLSAYDDLIENNTRRIAILEEMAQAIYREWFVHFRFLGHEKSKLINSPLGKIPEGWKVSLFGDLLESMRGGDWGSEQPNDEDNQAVVVVRGTDFHEVGYGGTLRVPLRYITSSSVKTRQLKDGDVIVENSVNAKSRCIGTPLLVDHRTLTRLQQPAIAASFCKVFRFHDPSVAPVAYWHLRHLRQTKRMEYYQNTAANGIGNFQAKKFADEETLLLPDDPKVRSMLVTQLSDACHAISNLASQIANLRRTRDLLLPKLISGQLDVEELDIDTGEPLVEATT